MRLILSTIFAFLCSASSINCELSHPSVVSFELEAHHPKLEAALVDNPHYFHSLENNGTQHKFMAKQIWVAPIVGCASTDFTASVMVNGEGPFQLIIDTGSTTTAVATALCTSCGVSPLLSLTGTTALGNANSVSSAYGDGSSWSGNSYNLKVQIGTSTNAISASTIIASIDAMGIAPSQNPFFKPNSCTNPRPVSPINQGIMGYAGNSLALAPTNQFFGNWVSQTGGANVFTIQMCKNSGNLWHGGYDSNFLSGSIVWTSINTVNLGRGANLYWYVVSLTDIALSATAAGTTFTSLGLPSTTYTSPNTSPKVYTIVDSGTSLFVLQPAAYKALVAALTTNAGFIRAFGANFFTANSCISPLDATLTTVSALNTVLPKIQLTITDGNGANPLTLILAGASSYVLTRTDPNNNNNLLFCPGIQMAGTAGANTAAVFNIMGWSVMNQFTIIHDLANMQMGFAASTCSKTDVTSSPGGVVAGGIVRANAVPTSAPGSGGLATGTAPPITQRPLLGAGERIGVNMVISLALPLFALVFNYIKKF